MEKEKRLVAEIANMDIFYQSSKEKSYWSVEKDERPVAILIDSFEKAVTEAAKAAGLLKIKDRGNKRNRLKVKWEGRAIGEVFNFQEPHAPSWTYITIEDTERKACDICAMSRIVPCEGACRAEERTDGKNVVYQPHEEEA